MQAKVNYS